MEIDVKNTLSPAEKQNKLLFLLLLVSLGLVVYLLVYIALSNKKVVQVEYVSNTAQVLTDEQIDSLATLLNTFQEDKRTVEEVVRLLRREQ